MKNKEIKEMANGTICTIKFVKKDNSLRVMHCRTGVKKYLNPDSKGQSDRQKEARDEFNHLVVLDIDIVKKSGLDIKNASEDALYAIRPYRTIPCDRILEIKTRGVVIKRDSLVDEFEVVSV